MLIYFYYYPGSFEKFRINFGYVNTVYIGNIGFNQLLFNLLDRISLTTVKLFGNNYQIISLFNYLVVLIVLLVTFLTKKFGEKP